MDNSGNIKIDVTIFKEDDGKPSEEYLNRIRALKQEISRKASMANKRIQRLERNELTNTPAYRNYIDGGGQKFSVKNKTYNELQAELARVNRFINSETSTIRGATRVAKRITQQVGLAYKSPKDLQNTLSKFFELSSKVEQYLRQMQGSASAIGYQKIWETINNYTQEKEIELSEFDGDLSSMVQTISEMITVEREEQAFNNWWDSI